MHKKSIIIYLNLFFLKIVMRYHKVMLTEIQLHILYNFFFIITCFDIKNFIIRYDMSCT